MPHRFAYIGNLVDFKLSSQNINNIFIVFRLKKWYDIYCEN